MPSTREPLRAQRASASERVRPLVIVTFAGTTLGTGMRVRRAVRRIQAIMRRGFDITVVVGAPRHVLRRIDARFAEIGLGGHDAGAERMRAARSAAEVPASLLAAALGMAGIAARSIPSDHASESAADACSRGVVPVVAVGGTFEGDIASHDGTSRAGILLAAALGAAACHVVVDTADGPASEDVPDVASFVHARVFAPAAFVGSIVPPDSARLAASAGVELVVYHHCAPARPIGAPFSARGLARRAGGAS